LREAALDPKLHKITLYRLAKNSQIISSLINAAGKKVTVQIELQVVLMKLLFYAEQMQLEGIELIFGIKGQSTQQNMCYRKNGTG
jgi:polyphosphate kinase